MRKSVLFLSLLLLSCGGPNYPTHVPPPEIEQKKASCSVEELNASIKWHEFGTPHVEKSLKEGKPIYIYFYSQNLASGQMNKTLNDPRVAKVVNTTFVPVKLDVDTEIGKDVARLLLQHTKTPTQLVLRKEDDDIGFYEFVGYVSPEEFLRASTGFE